MEAALARKLHYKDPAQPCYCLHLPKELSAQLGGPQLKTVLPKATDAQLGFVLLFALDSSVLHAALPAILPRLTADAKFWIAYPKLSSGITSDLNRDRGWEPLAAAQYEPVTMIAIDTTWSAARYRPLSAIKSRTRSFSQVQPVEIPGVDFELRVVTPPEDLLQLFEQEPAAQTFFNSLSFTHKKEYVAWITGAKKEETRARRLESTISMLKTGKKNPADK